MKNNDLSRKLYSFLPIIFYIALFAFLFRKFLGYGMLGYGDFDSFPARVNFKDSIFWWQSLTSGAVPLVVAHIFIDFLIFVTGNSAIAQKIFVIFPVVLAFAAMYIFLNRFTNAQFAKFIGSFIYTINLYTVGTLFGGTIGMLYAHAFFPFLVLLLLNIFERENKLFDTLLFAFLFAFTFSFAGYIVLITVPIVIVLLLNSLIKKQLRNALVTSMFMVVAGIVIFLLLLPWSYQGVKYVTSFFSPSPASSIKPTTLNNLLADVKATYTTTLIQTMTLQYNDKILGYGTSSPIALAGFILPVLAFSVLLFKHEKRKLKYIFSFSFLALGIILFIWLTSLGFTYKLFLTFPILFNFRNTAKPSLLLAFAYVPLIAIAIDRIQGNLRGLITQEVNSSPKVLLQISQAAIGVAILGTIFIHTLPFFGGDLALSRNRGKQMFVPTNFYKMGEWLANRREKEGFFRTLWLPWVYEETEIKIRRLDPYVFSVPLGAEKYGQISLPHDYSRSIAAYFTKKNPRHLGVLLAPFNVKYILVNMASDQKGSPAAADRYVLGSPSSFVKILNKQKDLELIDGKFNFSIYKNKKFIPHIASYNKALFIPQATGKSIFNFVNKSADNPGLKQNRYLSVFEELLPPRQRRQFLKEQNVVVFSKKEVPKESLQQPIINFRKINATEYRVWVRSKKPVYIGFGEAYSPRWNAYLGSEKLKHFPVFYGNGFYLDKIGRNEIRIIFAEKGLNKILNFIWALTWLFLLVSVLYYLANKALSRKRLAL